VNERVEGKPLAGLPDPKQFYRRIEAVLEGTPTGLTLRRLAERVGPRLLEQFSAPLGWRVVQLYDRSAEGYELRHHWGDAGPSSARELDRIAGDVPAEPDAEHPVWIARTAIGRTWVTLVDAERQTMFAFGDLDPAPLAEPIDPASYERLSFACTWIEHAFGRQLRSRRLESTLEQARAIQMSLLPAAAPAFGDYDIFASSIPAADVGGDVYDFTPIDSDTLGVTIADSSGHGLPAALQARDVVTGLRMGVERDFKINRIVEKLNRVIHRSGLSSRFISVVTGELEKNGNFAYVNAGHPAPLLLDDAGFHELSVGGTVVGPLPDSTYKMGFAHLDRGAILALVTDGILELGTEEGDPFGDERVREWMARWREGPAREAIDDLLDRLRGHAGKRGFGDDVSVVFIRRPREAR
jgi:hypothetical protein